MNENNLLGLYLFDVEFVVRSFVCKNLSIAAVCSCCTVSMTDSDTTQLFVFFVLVTIVK